MKWTGEAGEHLWAGILGHFLIVFSFVTALTGVFAFWKSSRNQNDFSSGKKLFFLHLTGVWSVVLLLIFMLFGRYFEYQYVWQHSNRDMDMQFVLSCLWEGQEGSFLLWICWNALAGYLYLIFSREDSSLKSLVAALILLIQAFLCSMILGIYIGDYRLGSSPFLLLKEHPDFMNLPFLRNEEYLKSLDGRGLNPLLMNYWMVIHPPVLFLGFCLSMFPFVQILARLIRTFEANWHRHVLPILWLAVGILGAGILMGGAWAYESLSFGGFWAWDPVENSSLVPWMLLVAGGHILVVHKIRGTGFLTGILTTSMAFIFVLYSTFLTRSGILGNASVHSFTDLGMQGQLLTYLCFFIFLFSLFLIPQTHHVFRWIYLWFVVYGWFFSILYNVPSIGLVIFLLLSCAAWVFSGYLHQQQNPDNNPSWTSREFIMFLGAVIFFLLAYLIITFTSLPVINSLTGSNYAMPKVRDYNRITIPFISVGLILMGYAQFLKFKNTPLQQIKKQSFPAFIIALATGVTAGIPLFLLRTNGTFTLYERLLFLLLLFSGAYALASNLLQGRKLFIKKFFASGSYLSHAGFALLILGALISTSKKTIISRHEGPMDLKSLGQEFDNQRAVLLTQGDTIPLGPYRAVYKEKRREGINVYFSVDFLEKHRDTFKYSFTLYPRVQDHPRMGKASDPDTRHFFSKDVYVFVSYADLSDNTGITHRGFSEPKNYKAHLRDTIVLNNAMIIPDTLFFNKFTLSNDSVIRVFMGMVVHTSAGKTYTLAPFLDIKKQSIFSDFQTDSISGIMINFWKINPEEASFEFIIKEDLSGKKDFIVMEAHVFPAINILWTGCILMMAGILIHVLEKVIKNKRHVA